MSNTSELNVEGKKVTLTQTTEYPWNGDIRVSVSPKGKQNFTLKIRIPGWVQGEVVPSNLYSFTDNKQLNYSVKVNGETFRSNLDKGYFAINRLWKKGDVVEVHFDMEPRTVKANSKVEADRGKISVERGPLVYCAEWPDNDFSVLSVFMNRKPEFTVERKPELLYGIDELKTQAQTLGYDETGRLVTKDVTLTLIPYYAWAHRGTGEMAVWLPQDVSATRPVMPPTIASKAKITASHMAKSISAINDGLTPKDENDRTAPYYHWWPQEGTTEWIAYEFEQPEEISSTTIYWYDDAPWGGCRIPQSWKIYYKDASGNWQPVANTSSYGIAKGEPNTVRFTPVKTSAVKLEVVQPEKNSAGLFEWAVE